MPIWENVMIYVNNLNPFKLEQILAESAMAIGGMMK